MKSMFEVLSIIHKVTPLKGADLVHRTGIGPKGTYHGSKVELQVQWPRGVTESSRDSLAEELRKAKFKVNVDTRPGAGELGTIEVYGKGEQNTCYITFDPKNSEAHIKVVPWSKKRETRKLGPLTAKILELRLAKLIRQN